MKLYAPRYYKDFKCIADRCRHSCCIGWEIGVDGETLCRYDALPKSEREEILFHIEEGVIRLSDGKRCPFLDESGLCRIISRYGDSYTCEICREHPRFYNSLADRVEAGLGASCEEAARIILESDGYDDITAIGETDGEPLSEYNALPERSFIYSVLRNTSSCEKGKFDIIKGKYGLRNELFESERLTEMFSELEFLMEENRERFAVCKDTAKREPSPYSERFFAYLVYRHLSSAISYEDLRARLCMCIALLLLFESLCRRGTEYTEAARVISEEIEYSEDNTDSLIFNFECEL